jgi:hypothetical protein
VACNQAHPSGRAGAREKAAAWEEALKKAYGRGSGTEYWAWGVYAGEGFMGADHLNWADNAAPWLAIGACRQSGCAGEGVVRESGRRSRR